MATIDKNGLLELEILKHVEETPKLNNRMAASKLGCSVKLAHALLTKMVDRGLLHVKKLHSRRWDYFLTPRGITEKARLTYEFLDFSMHFYHDARKQSSLICRKLAEAGNKTVAFIGAGDLAEIVYLGVKEWGLELIEVFDGEKKEFLGHPVVNRTKLSESKADAIIICLYERDNPMSINYLPEDIKKTNNMYWVFEKRKEVLTTNLTNKTNGGESNTQVNIEPMKKYINRENAELSAAERMAKFEALQKSAFENMSPEGKKCFHRRNMKKRAVAIQTEENKGNKAVKIFGSFEEEEKAESQRRSAMTVSDRLEEFAVIQERVWGDKWTRTPIARKVSFEKVKWANVN